MVTRRIGKFLRGKATPLQVMMATVLGAMIGFVPGVAQGAGLLLTLLLLLIILNANLIVSGFVMVLAKIASLALMPVSFAAGRILLDGPTEPLFRMLINAPVFALFGFEYYATTGGIITGLLFGVVCGLALNAVLYRFRRKMASLEQGSDRFKKWNSKRSVKTLKFVFVGGGHGKKTYEELMQRRFGNPVRVLGIIFAVLAVAFVWVLSLFLQGPIVTYAMRTGLERANGATVDLREADIDLREGRFTLHELAMADPNDLTTDLLRAVRVEGAISSSDLLRKRLALDTVRLVDASNGEQRARPGRLVTRPPAPPSDREPLEIPDIEDLETYIENARVWKERLAQVREWLEKISGPETETIDPDAPDAQRRETLGERLARQIEELGYARVRADHLIETAPTFLVRELVAEDMRSTRLPEERFEMRGENISTHPHLVEATPRLVFRTSLGTIDTELSLAEIARNAGADASNLLRFNYKGLDVDRFVGNLKFLGNTPPMRGGTIDVASEGTWRLRDGGWIELPLHVTLHNTEMSIAGSRPTTVERLELPLGVIGPLDSPGILFREEDLMTALVNAGKNELANQLRQKLGDQLDGRIPDGLLPGGLQDAGGNILDGLFDGLRRR